DGSYGIEVAKLAGVPNTVVKRAHEVLEEIVAAQTVTQAGNLAKPFSDVDSYYGGADDSQISFAGTAGNAIVDELKNIDVNTLTPIEAMQYLYDLVKKAKEN
ncbi:MAG: DNA mismatch repair protein MutS, partial [Clostridia bacterium]|nr:DNA mismatch repair protein MutS [Clostridia bacterium]